MIVFGSQVRMEPGARPRLSLEQRCASCGTTVMLTKEGRADMERYEAEIKGQTERWIFLCPPHRVLYYDPGVAIYH